MGTDNVFTVFNHGTDFHRDKDPNELITLLSRAVAGKEARIVQTGERTIENPLPFRLEFPDPSYVVCEGPGSDEVAARESSSGVGHAHPGKYNPLFNTDKRPGESQKLNPGLQPTGGKKYWLVGKRQSSEFQDDFMGNTPKTSQVAGRALGNGWDDNVYKVAWLITHLKWEAGRPIDTVNIIGWSRGAVSCLKMANKLFEVFEDTLNVNIFAVDPVPGGFTPETCDCKTIPPNVRDYLAILALDDDRSNFQPLDRSKVRLLGPKSQHGENGNPDSLNPSRVMPRVHFLPMPGNHSDLVNSELSSPWVEGSANLCRYLAWQFLNAHGTEFTAPFDSRADAMCRRYQRLLTHRQAIADAASGGLVDIVGGYRKERSVRAHRGDYVADSDTYINEHHRLYVLREAYPDCTHGEAYFPDDWHSPWSENRTFPLPEKQSYLLKMGIAAG